MAALKRAVMFSIIKEMNMFYDFDWKNVKLGTVIVNLAALGTFVSLDDWKPKYRRCA